LPRTQPKPDSLTARGTERLRRAILEAELQLGEALSEDKLANALNVSRTPVREALTVLQAQGLIDIQPQRGSFVFVPSEADLVELCEFRRMIEVEALRLCFSRAREKTLRDLRNAVSAMDAARRARDQKASVRADSVFHDALLANCSNHYLVDAYRLVSGRVAALRAHRSSGAIQKDANDEHHAIVDAVARNDLATAEAVLAAHVLKMRERYAVAIARQSTGGAGARRRGPVELTDDE
jgi:DNA-binding GntR family transcriptional regulator